jgi:hypothetical protein
MNDGVIPGLDRRRQVKILMWICCEEREGVNLNFECFPLFEVEPKLLTEYRLMMFIIIIKL